MSRYVNVPVKPATKKKLDTLKLYQRETYDQLVQRLMKSAVAGSASKDGENRSLKDTKKALEKLEEAEA
ncbi:MAG: hypothetical protein JRN26_05480 [Nitrososphaerota archaeon]|jgi:hypothetical protein|nr:hypothetical protein [Nitrososphaerota archaeon]MDG6927176.1 hypothetical protein [Nitrososphaerota archaeon]MDG6930836.1 hypothetical protein [Nitrososphaerota archaeon]MDG6932280.1 hypothetical protein [Nitrososphaerota archaeon]MDG6936315.1 hypothetical protein [Nitrososphaerota archaeon]